MQRKRGYVLVFVLVVLLFLSLVMASVYGNSEEQVMMSGTMVSQRVAAARAEEAAQRAVAFIKGGELSSTVMQPCRGPDTPISHPVPQCLGSDVATSGLVSTAGSDTSQGAGMRYQWWAFKSDQTTQNTNLVTIRAEGYWGLDAGALSFATAVIEVEMLVPQPKGGQLSAEFDYNLFR